MFLNFFVYNDSYYISMGSVFFLEDLTHNTDVFAAKVAAQYLFGAQLGWFSLGGSDVQVPYMGMYEALMSPVYDPEVEFLKLLSRAKTAGNRWLQEGRAMRELLLVVNGTRMFLIKKQSLTLSTTKDSYPNSIPHS